MSLTIWPVVEVEACGAKWSMAEPVRGADMVQVAAATMIADTHRRVAISGDLAEAVHVYFTEAIRGWSDVLGPDGEQLPFSTEAASGLSPSLKASVVEAAIARRNELQGNATGPGE